MTIPFLATLLGSQIVQPILYGFALLAMVLAVLIWVMEFSGWTITPKGFRRNNVPWNATSIALLAVSAAIYIATRPLQLQFVPGIGGFNPTMALAPVFSVLFGLPGAVGVTFSMPIGDAISGALTLGSVAGFLSHTFVTWLPYKMITMVPDLRKGAAWGQYYLWGIIIGPIIHSIVIPGWLALTSVLPPAVAWGAVTPAILLNHMIFSAIVSPILLLILYPVVKARGLFWRDRYQTAE
jgi:energy-coupling factor transport system substrate-specific component